jgi:hypothetical protein
MVKTSQYLKKLQTKTSLAHTMGDIRVLPKLWATLANLPTNRTRWSITHASLRDLTIFYFLKNPKLVINKLQCLKKIIKKLLKNFETFWCIGVKCLEHILLLS